MMGGARTSTGDPRSLASMSDEDLVNALPQLSISKRAENHGAARKACPP